MTKDKYLDFCRSIGGAEVDQPFESDFDTYVVRHVTNRKWFALLMFHDNRWIVNLKCDPIEADFLRKVYEGVFPAYHMNKTHWNSVALESDVPAEELERMTLSSFSLTDKKQHRKG